MKLNYYPGCTLKNKARNFEDSTLSSMEHLEVELEELNRWNCCGTVYSMASDDLMRRLAPIRNLIRVKEAEGTDTSKFITSCAMCYNTTKRANEDVKSNPEMLNRMNDFMYDEEVDYEGDVDVIHLLEVLRDQIGFDDVAKKVKKPLKDLKVASYYGCLLTRPREVAFDDIENPTVMDDLVSSLGAEPVDFTHKTVCCGSYQTVDKPDIIADQAYEILTSAQDQKADMVVVSCPLCAFNLDQRQEQTLEKYPQFNNIPVVYFTQLMAVAFGRSETALQPNLHYIDPEPILAEKELI